MTYNQDLINQAYQIGQAFVLQHGFQKMELTDKLLLKKIPEDLANEVVLNLELEDKEKRKKKAKKHVLYGVLLLLVSILIGVGSMIYTENMYIVFAGTTFVPGLAFTAMGLWELFD